MTRPRQPEISAVPKLLTAGGCGVWAIVDWFLIMDATREKNFQQLVMWAGGRPY